MALAIVLVSVPVFVIVLFVAILAGSGWWKALLLAYGIQLGGAFVAVVGLSAHYMRVERNRAKTGWANQVASEMAAVQTPNWISVPTTKRDRLPFGRVAIAAADETGSRKCCKWLSEAGFEAHLCTDIDVILEELMSNSHRWSLLIIDPQGIGGSEALHLELDYLRSELPDFPIVLLTEPDSAEEYRQRAAEQKYKVLVKPFYRGTLRFLLRRLFCRAHGHRLLFDQQ